jgi:hypothetical protein
VEDPDRVLDHSLLKLFALILADVLFEPVSEMVVVRVRLVAKVTDPRDGLPVIQIERESLMCFDGDLPRVADIAIVVVFVSS